MEVQVLTTMRPYQSSCAHTALDLGGSWVTVYRADDWWRCSDYIKRKSREEVNVFRVDNQAGLSVRQHDPKYFYGSGEINPEELIAGLQVVIPRYKIYRLDYLAALIGAPCSWEVMGRGAFNHWGVERELKTLLRADSSSLYCAVKKKKSIEFYYGNAIPITPQEAAQLIAGTASYRVN